MGSSSRGYVCPKCRRSQAGQRSSCRYYGYSFREQQTPELHPPQEKYNARTRGEFQYPPCRSDRAVVSSPLPMHLEIDQPILHHSGDDTRMRFNPVVLLLERERPLC